MHEFAQTLHDVFARFGAISLRKMFGGYGVYHQGLMFGLVADDVLYLKVDAHSKADFISQNLLPFVYEGKGKPVAMSYHRAPDSIYDDADAAAHWARMAYAAALRNYKPKQPRKPKQAKS